MSKATEIAIDDVRAGDRIKLTFRDDDVTFTREGVVDHIDPDGFIWTATDSLIASSLEMDTYDDPKVERLSPELPTEHGAVIYDVTDVGGTTYGTAILADPREPAGQWIVTFHDTYMWISTDNITDFSLTPPKKEVAA